VAVIMQLLIGRNMEEECTCLQHLMHSRTSDIFKRETKTVRAISCIPGIIDR
jgi:hypothetical protein